MSKGAEEDKYFNRAFIVCLIAVALVFGGIAGPNYFFIGVLATVFTPVGWIFAGLLAWVVTKLFPPAESPVDTSSRSTPKITTGHTREKRFGAFPSTWIGLESLDEGVIQSVRRAAYGRGTAYPSRDLLFRAYWLTQPRDVSVVMLGTDPYPTPGEADGLAFSAKKATTLPPTLDALFNEMHRDLDLRRRAKGNLSDWARQGVLLLNTSLTVQPGVDEWNTRSNAEWHARAWRPLIEATIRTVDSSPTPVAFVLLGQPAQSFSHLISPRHFVLRVSHPSPRAAMRETELPALAGSRVFSKVNRFLSDSGRSRIDWVG